VRVIGRVQQATAVGVITHTEGGGGDVQARALLESDVPAARIQIGHVDHKNSSMRYWWRLLGLGVTLGFDRVGAAPFMDDTMRAAIVAGLIASGRRDQLTISMDGVINHFGPAPAVYSRMQTPVLHLLKTFIPQLRTFGVADDDIRKILIANPRRLLSGE
jgi:phosphotriesterase-related protein